MTTANIGSVQGRKLFIATATANGPVPSEQAADLDEAGFEALDWTQVSHPTRMGSFDPDIPINAVNVIDGPAIKHKGTENAGDPELAFVRNKADNGQIALIAAGKTDFIYAFKQVFNDAQSSGDTNTVKYTRGLVRRVIVETAEAGGEDIISTSLGLIQSVVDATDAA